MDTDALVNWLVSNLKWILGSLGAVICILLLAGAYSSYRAGVEQKAIDALYQVREEVDKLSNDGNWSEALNRMQVFADEYSGTRAQFEALLDMAKIARDNRDYGKAVVHLTKAQAEAPNAFMRLLVLYNTAGVYEEKKAYTEAANTYAKALQLKESKFLAPELMLSQARAYEQAKQNQIAATIYQKIQEEFVQHTQYVRLANIFLKKLEEHNIK